MRGVNAGEQAGALLQAAFPRLWRPMTPPMTPVQKLFVVLAVAVSLAVIIFAALRLSHTWPP